MVTNYTQQTLGLLLSCYFSHTTTLPPTTHVIVPYCVGPCGHITSLFEQESSQSCLLESFCVELSSTARSKENLGKSMSIGFSTEIYQYQQLVYQLASMPRVYQSSQLANSQLFQLPPPFKLPLQLAQRSHVRLKYGYGQPVLSGTSSTMQYCTVQDTQCTQLIVSKIPQ